MNEMGQPSSRRKVPKRHAAVSLTSDKLRIHRSKRRSKDSPVTEPPVVKLGLAERLHHPHNVAHHKSGRASPEHGSGLITARLTRVVHRSRVRVDLGRPAQLDVLPSSARKQTDMLNVVREASGISGGGEAVKGRRGEVDRARIPGDNVVATLHDLGKLKTSASDELMPRTARSARIGATG